MLTDDGGGRTLDGLSAHDPTTPCADSARRACQVVGVSTSQVPVDTTSFSVHGDDAATQVIAAEGEEGAPDVEADPALLPIMSGSSRDHREDLTL